MQILLFERYLYIIIQLIFKMSQHIDSGCSFRTQKAIPLQTCSVPHCTEEVTTAIICSLCHKRFCLKYVSHTRLFFLLYSSFAGIAFLKTITVNISQPDLHLLLLLLRLYIFFMLQSGETLLMVYSYQSLSSFISSIFPLHFKATILLRKRAKAKGSKSIPIEKRRYFDITISPSITILENSHSLSPTPVPVHPHSAQPRSITSFSSTPPPSFQPRTVTYFFSKDFSVGRTIDAISSAELIPNKNNIPNQPVCYPLPFLLSSHLLCLYIFILRDCPCS